MSDWWCDDDLDVESECPAIPDVDRPRQKVRRLYGPNGEVLRSFSKRPPVGFHQGERGEPRR